MEVRVKYKNKNVHLININEFIVMHGEEYEEQPNNAKASPTDLFLITK